MRQLTIRFERFLAVLLLAFVFSGISGGLYAETFRYRHSAGDKYRILSVVSEDVLINGALNNHSEIVNRISVEVTDVVDGAGIISANFMTSEEAVLAGEVSSKPAFVWSDEYLSVFSRDELGVYDISDSFFMPVVRNVPVFPEEDLQPGDTWFAEGEEAHDLRRTFGLMSPMLIPFVAEYCYEGTAEVDGKTLHLITVEYSMYADYPAKVSTAGNVPVSAMGYVSQEIFWDNEAGAIETYDETFSIVLYTKSGTRIEYRGTSSSEITERQTVTARDTVASVQKQIEDLDIEGAVVIADERGLTLSLENIQFKADSSYLQESEKIKLKKIAGILESFPDNDLLISGHTARAGSEESCQTLSEKRAQAVADFLQSIGVKDKYHIYTRGYGSSVPVADNGTAEGMARNRRVEITIMEM